MVKESIVRSVIRKTLEEREQEYGKKHKTVKVEQIVVDGLVASLDCRYKLSEVYEGFFKQFKKELNVQAEDVVSLARTTTDGGDFQTKFLDLLMAESFARHATAHFEESLPSVLNDALKSGFKEAVHNAQFDWDFSGFPDIVEEFGSDWANSVAGSVDSKKESSAQACVKFAADAAKTRVTQKQRRKSATLVRVMDEAREAAKLRRKIVSAIRRLLVEERRIPKKAAIARESGISHTGNTTQALQDVLNRYGWPLPELVRGALSSDF